MQIPNLSVNKYKSSIIFCIIFPKKSLGLVLFSKDSRVAANMTYFFSPNNIARRKKDNKNIKAKC